MKLGADEAVNQEEGDKVERAITTDRIDTSGRPMRQETMGGTSAQTRSERVLEQPNEPPLTEGHTFGSGERRLEENIELADIVPTPHDSPLTGGYTPRNDEGRITLAELIETSKILSNRVTQLEIELSTTKVVYNNAFITLTFRVKKLKSQLKQKRNKVVIHSLDEKGPRVHIEDSPKYGRIIKEMDKDENINLMSLAKDKGKGIMQEPELPKKLKKKEMIQLSLDEELAQKLYAEELAKEEARQEQERYNLEKALELQRQLDQRKKLYLKIEREVMKRAGFGLHQGSSKKQRLDQQTEETEEEAKAQGDSDQEVEELKLYMRIIPEEDIAIEAIPLAVKPPIIIEYKIVRGELEGKRKRCHEFKKNSENDQKESFYIEFLQPSYPDTGGVFVGYGILIKVSSRRKSEKIPKWLWFIFYTGIPHHMFRDFSLMLTFRSLIRIPSSKNLCLGDYVGYPGDLTKASFRI
nr:hypothetical protein [Tanacetum cinerariifolium]